MDFLGAPKTLQSTEEAMPLPFFYGKGPGLLTLQRETGVLSYQGVMVKWRRIF